MKQQRNAPRELGFRGRQVLAYIRSCIDLEGRAPSYGMIREELGLADNGQVRLIVTRLERRGLVRRAGHGRVRRLQLLAA